MDQDLVESIPIMLLEMGSGWRMMPKIRIVSFAGITSTNCYYLLILGPRPRSSYWRTVIARF
jgi:hypothetical protein